eukprot:1160241-Pelagomonas_calceolata.AAC.3
MKVYDLPLSSPQSRALGGKQTEEVSHETHMLLRYDPVEDVHCKYANKYKHVEQIEHLAPSSRSTCSVQHASHDGSSRSNPMESRRTV